MLVLDSGIKKVKPPHCLSRDKVQLEWAFIKELITDSLHMFPFHRTSIWVNPSDGMLWALKVIAEITPQVDPPPPLNAQ